MKRTLTFVLAFSVLVPCGGQNRNRLLNDDWRFVRDSLAGAEAVRFDDSSWKTVDLPHDFSLEPLPAGPNTLGPFSRETKGGRSVGYLPGGTGWYRKVFSLDKADAGKSVSLVFDGAYMLTDVWVNGRKAAAHKNGYTPFAFDVTELLNPAGQENVLAVRVVNYGKNSRWYSGSGLYRDVELVADPHDHSLDLRVFQHPVIIGIAPVRLEHSLHFPEQVIRNIADRGQMNIPCLHGTDQMCCLADLPAPQDPDVQQRILLTEICFHALSCLFKNAGSAGDLSPSAGITKRKG